MKLFQELSSFKELGNLIRDNDNISNIYIWNEAYCMQATVVTFLVKAIILHCHIVSTISKVNEKSLWFHLFKFCPVRFQMCPQITCQGGCIITLIAFVRLFSTVCFQMSPQMTCLRGSIFAMIALV